MNNKQNIYHLSVLDFSRLGKPTDNAFIELFKGKLREECLNESWFFILGRCPEQGRDLAAILQPKAASGSTGLPVPQGVYKY